MILRLIREISTDKATQGRFDLPETIYTLERPWLDNQKGVSCVPVGTYDLHPHVRPNGDRVYQLIAPKLGVYATEDEIPYGTLGRSEILIHPANYVHQLLGCIAPGTARGTENNDFPAVMFSQKAMAQLRAVLGETEVHTLVIVNEA